MTLLHRWTKFTLVGALGMAVQLTALAILNRCFPDHYLLTTASALELTLLHNAAWHMRTTWRDRQGSASALHHLTRFHLSNGLISLIGNLALMRLLIHSLHLPVVAANLIAILCCSLANFYLGDRWAFVVIQPPESPQIIPKAHIPQAHATAAEPCASPTGHHTRHAPLIH